MCVNPISVKINGRLQSVACRKCKQCRDNRIRDYVGRVIAESQTAVGTTFITLTYGSSQSINGADSVYEAKVLTYADVQRWLKRIRFDGYKVRYFIVGEYGSRKGRAHWHAIMFWQNRVPNYMEGINDWEDKYWTPFAHGGHTVWQTFEPHLASYAAKYMLKDIDDEESQSEYHISKLPPLGHEYFMQLAARYVDQGLLPQSPEYWFPHIKKRDGSPRRFMMGRKSLENFCERFIMLWERKYGYDAFAFQHSEFLMDYLDSLAQRASSDALARRKYIRAPHLPTGLWSDGEPVKATFDERRNTWCYTDLNGQVWWWSFDENGERAWAGDVVTETEAMRRRSSRAYADRLLPSEYRAASMPAGPSHPRGEK